MMALNIKNSETERLAHEVAQHTGETLTQAVTRALEERLERLRGRIRAPETLEKILEISRRCSSQPDLDPRSPDEILGYDAMGAYASDS
jgi:antitoxin VapB